MMKKLLIFEKTEKNKKNNCQFYAPTVEKKLTALIGGKESSGFWACAGAAAQERLWIRRFRTLFRGDSSTLFA